MNSRLLAVCLLLPLGAVAQVYKCPSPSGKTVYSDRPCGAGQVMDSSALKANSLPASRRENDTSRSQQHEAQRGPQALVIGGSTGNAPSAQIRDLEVSASSVTIPMLEQCNRWRQVVAAYENANTRAAQDARANAADRCQKAGRGALPPTREEAEAEAAANAAGAPAMLTNCDLAGCWDTAGNRYSRAAGAGNFFRQDGRACQTVGNQVRCQ